MQRKGVRKHLYSGILVLGLFALAYAGYTAFMQYSNSMETNIISPEEYSTYISASGAAKGDTTVSEHVSITHQDDIRSSFYHSNDLLSLVEQWSYLREQGDPDANFYTAQAYTECFQFLHNPNANQYITNGKAFLSLSLKSGSALYTGISHWDRLSLRCGSFLTQDQVNAEQIEQWLRVAANHGSSAAKIDLILRNKESLESYSVDELHDLLVKSITDRDHESLVRLADLMGSEGEVAREYLGKYSGSQNDRAAWVLIACDLGADCGPAHSELKTGCMLAGNWCQYSSLIDFYLNEALSPAAANRVNAKRFEILQLIQSNQLDKLF